MTSVAMGEAEGAGLIGGAAPSAPNRDVGGGDQPDTPLPTRDRQHRRRWPIWSEPQTRTICNICGFAGSHSTVCPFGPEPTKSRATGRYPEQP